MKNDHKSYKILVLIFLHIENVDPDFQLLTIFLIRKKMSKANKRKATYRVFGTQMYTLPPQMTSTYKNK